VIAQRRPPSGVSHLLAADSLTPYRWGGSYISVCGLELHASSATGAQDGEFRYCSECVGEAVRWSAEPAEQGGGGR
jgi:hypothetical protein